MTVFVDNYQGRFGRMIMCHMMTDTDLNELHAMAEAIGLRREWFQSHGSAPHYDVCKMKRQEAIARGAVELSIRSEDWRRVYRAAKQLKTDSGL